jgi:hypothetical protein
VLFFWPLVSRDEGPEKEKRTKKGGSRGRSLMKEELDGRVGHDESIAC